jgi:hypothetical protein
VAHAVGTNTADLALKINPSSGRISGKFMHPDILEETSLTGVVFQKQHMAAGFFLGTTEIGAFQLTPAQPPVQETR